MIGNKHTNSARSADRRVGVAKHESAHTNNKRDTNTLIRTNDTNKNSSAGFTLVELIVAVAIFAAVITIASSIFVSSIGSQRENINQQEVLDNARFVLEIMGRAIRQSTVLTCPDQASCTSNSISLNHPVKGAVTYQLTNGRISENGSTLISGGVLATRLDFIILGNGLSDNTQPRVVVVMSLKNFNPRADTQNFIDLQTTITPRNLQIQ